MAKRSSYIDTSATATGPHSQRNKNGLINGLIIIWFDDIQDLYKYSQCSFKVEYTYGDNKITDDNNGELYAIQFATSTKKLSYYLSQESFLSDLLFQEELVIY